MRLFDRIRHFLRGVPFYIVLLCGLVGVLVDFDHIVAYYALGIRTPGLRVYHPEIAFVSGVVLCCAGAYIGGLYIRRVLKQKYD